MLNIVCEHFSCLLVEECEGASQRTRAHEPIGRRRIAPRRLPEKACLDR